MDFFNTFDITTSFVSDPAIDEIEFNKQLLKKICGQVDDFMEENEAYGFSVYVDNENNDIIMHILCVMFEFECGNSTFMKVVGNAKEVGFRAKEENHVEVIFRFDGERYNPNGGK